VTRTDFLPRHSSKCFRHGNRWHCDTWCPAARERRVWIAATKTERERLTGAPNAVQTALDGLWELRRSRARDRVILILLTSLEAMPPASDLPDAIKRERRAAAAKNAATVRVYQESV